jgi:hypothetical protein
MDTNELAKEWNEYDAAADWCAARGLKGMLGDALPEGLSTRAMRLISTSPESFESRVRDMAYARAMNRIEIEPESGDDRATMDTCQPGW